MKRIALSLALFAVLPGGAAQRESAVTVQLLAINDFHGNLEPPAGVDGLVNRIPAGGAEYLATHLRDAARDHRNSILVAAGDLMGASPLISGAFQDRPAIEALNAMNLAVTSIGNHELDHGPGELLGRIRRAHYQYLAANVVRTNGRFLTGTAVRTVGGVKIGFVGETLEGTRQLIPPASADGLRFLEESSAANEAAARLEGEGVRAIVLLIHQGGAQSAASGAPDPNGCADFSGDIVGIVNKLSPSIKVVISGHTHQFYNCAIAGHTVTSAGSYGRLFTRVALSIDRRSDTIVKASATNEVVTRDVAKDPAQTAILEKYRPRVARIANRTVGAVTSEISRTANDAGESAFGDVIADAQLASVNGAEIAFVNPGSIRTSIAGSAGTDGQRAVSYAELFTAQPFGNLTVVFTLTGDAIRRVLEQQFPADGTPNFLQVSAGFTYRYRLNAPAGAHVEAGSIALNGRPIDPQEVLRVEANNFLMGGGDGFTIFGEGRNAVTGPTDVDALAEYFRTHSPVAPGPRNRIVRVD